MLLCDLDSALIIEYTGKLFPFPVNCCLWVSFPWSKVPAYCGLVEWSLISNSGLEQILNKPANICRAMYCYKINLGVDILRMTMILILLFSVTNYILYLPLHTQSRHL